MSRRYGSPSPRQFTRLNRQSIARISSGIGALALVVAIMAFLIQRDVTLIVLVSILISIGGIGLWSVLAPGDLRAMVSGRQALYGSNSIFVTILVIGIVAIIYGLSQGTGIAADFTSVGYYSPKPNTLPVLQRLDKPILITAFYASRALNLQAIDKPILQLFVDAAPDKIKLRIVDPDQQPLIANQFGLNAPYGLYVSQLDQNGQPDLNLTVQIPGDQAREQQIAEAILTLQARGKFKVLFTIGHNEIDTTSTATDGASGLRQGLESRGILTGTTDLTQDIPVDTNAVVMLAPQRDFTQAEVDKIAKYTAGGGKLLVMAKPAFNGAITFMVAPTSPMSRYMLATWGLGPQNDIVYDPQSFLQSQYAILAARVSQVSPIVYKDTAGTTQVRPFLAIAQSWALTQTLTPDQTTRPSWVIPQPPPTGVEITPLMFSSDQSYGKTNLVKVSANPDQAVREAGDLAGPLLLAASAQNQQTGAQIIVIGEGDWCRNDSITQFDGSLLWTNMVNWLTRFDAAISVTPVFTQLPLRTDTISLNITLLITLVILPGLVLIAGAWMWWDRSRR